jgi:hypothetical protein
VDEVIDFLVAVLAPAADLAEVGPTTPLESLGVVGDLDLFDLGEMVAEEYGERTLGEFDTDEIRTARTVGELAEVYARLWAGPTAIGNRIDPDGR